MHATHPWPESISIEVSQGGHHWRYTYHPDSWVVAMDAIRRQYNNGQLPWSVARDLAQLIECAHDGLAREAGDLGCGDSVEAYIRDNDGPVDATGYVLLACVIGALAMVAIKALV